MRYVAPGTTFRLVVNVWLVENEPVGLKACENTTAPLALKSSTDAVKASVPLSRVAKPKEKVVNIPTPLEVATSR